jgi:NADH:ubiquinone oxidoreductase subunit F (NADH-binding)
MDILTKIKKAKLVGRGGACFPTAIKWESVKKADGGEKYVVCNAAEGEPGIKKDGFILENYAPQVMDGIEIAIKYLKAKKAFVYINPDYYKKHKNKISLLIGDKNIELIPKKSDAGYIGGEESAILNAIEEKTIEPRLKPPFPTLKGLWGMPTLINNVETFYNISLVNSGEFKNKRFYTINGDTINTGVFCMNDNYSIKKILKETGNTPGFSFFVQVGGDASGEVLNDKQLNRPVSGSGSITVYSLKKYKPINLIKNWLLFFENQSCGQCTPCREGTYRLMEILNSRKPDWELFSDLLINLKESSFCGLGCAAPIAVISYFKNILKNIPDTQIKIKDFPKKYICECFKNF